MAGARPVSQALVTSRRGAAFAALLLSALLGAAFRGALLGRLFYLRDVVQNHVPMRRMVTARLLSGSLPLWDPLHGGGTPLLADPNNLVLHPITLLFLVLPFDVAFTASIVLQYALLAAGCWLLARALGVGSAPAALAAAVAALAGPAASLASLQNVLSAAAWVPLALWGLLRYLDNGRRRFAAASAAALAVVLITGEAASLAAALLLGAALVATRPAAGSRAAAPGARPASAPPAARSAVFISLLAILLSSAGTLPAAALVGLTPRAHGLPPSETLRWSLAPARLAELALPQLFGDPTRLSPAAWWGAGLFDGGYPFFLSAYLGVAPLLLASAALLAGPARKRAVALAAAGGAALLVALGGATPVGRALFLSGPGRAIRYPERFLLVATLALALLAALGLERLLRLGRASRSFAVFAAVAAALLLGASALAARPTAADGLLSRFLRLPAGFAESDAMPVVRGGVLHALLWACVEALLLAAAAAAMARGTRRAARASAWGIAAACGVSLLLAGEPARSTAAPGWLEAPSPLRDVVARGAGAPRVHHAPRPPGLRVWARTDEQIWGYRYDRFAYALETGHPDGVPTVLDAATDRMDLAGSATLGPALAGRPPAVQARVLRVARAGTLLSYDDLHEPDLPPGPVLEGLSQPPLRVFEVKDPVPRVRFVTRARPPARPDDPVTSLSDPDFDPAREVLLEETPAPRLRGDPGTAPPAGSAPASLSGGVASPPPAPRVLQDDPERVRIEVVAGAPGYVVLADAWAPGWRARVDGRAATILRADLLFRAVEVGAGRHEVEMTYRPLSVILGFAASILGAALTLAWARPRGERAA